MNNIRKSAFTKMLPICNEKGSSIIFVIVIIIILTIFFGIVLLLFTAQKNFIKRSQFKLQSRYSAEAGIYCMIDSLQQNIELRSENESYVLSWGDTCNISIRQFGGFLEIVSTGLKKGNNTKLRVLVGEVPGKDFDCALTVSDDRSHVTFTGDCNIIGDIRTGKMGTQIRPFKGKKFTGNINGSVFSEKKIELPQFKNDLYENLINQFDRDLLIPPMPYIYFKHLKLKSNYRKIEGINNVYYSDDDIVINSALQEVFNETATFISKKNIEFSDSVMYAVGSIFIAGEDILLNDKVSGRQGIFYSQRNIKISGNVDCEGQFIAQNKITITDQVKLNYPSVLYLIGKELRGERTGNIEILEDAIVKGSIIYLRSESFGVMDKGKIYIGTRAEINGVIYSANQIDFNGTIDGSLLTYQLYFYDAPTHYINWLRKGYININNLYQNFCLPLYFNENPQLSIVFYEEL